MYEHISLIYNPYAGGLKGAKIGRLDCAERALRLHGRQVTRHATRGPRTAGIISRECIARGSDLIVAAGGDGTINEVADGLVGSTIPLSVLPAGTANVLAHEIGLGGDLERAARNLGSYSPRHISMSKLSFDDGTAQRFLLMAGAGFDAHIVFHLDAGWKSRLGKAAYWLGGARQFGRSLEEFEVEVEGVRHTCSFALISKVRNYGGDLLIAREVRLIDPQFEVVLFAGDNSYRYLVYLAGVMMNRLRGMRGVTVTRASAVRLFPRNGEAVHLQVDGEYAGRLPATISAEQSGLIILIPPRYLA